MEGKLGDIQLPVAQGSPPAYLSKDMSSLACTFAIKTQSHPLAWATYMKSETKLLQRFTGVGAAPDKAQSTVTLNVVSTTTFKNTPD